MACPRCGADSPTWCKDCENLYDTWSRQHAADIVWQTGSGAAVAMILVLGGLVLGASPLLGIGGFMAGFGTFMGMRRFGNRKRRQQFIAASVPRAYLPSG